MVSMIVDERFLLVSLALTLIRSSKGDKQTITPHAQRAIAAAAQSADEPLISLLRRYFHASREFLVYGHAAALGPAPTFERVPGNRLPTYLMAMPALLGAEFPLALRSFYAVTEIQQYFRSVESDLTVAAAELSEAVASLPIDTAIAQWFPGAVVNVKLVPDLTGQPGQVVSAVAGETQYFACAPSAGKCRWDAAHIGSAVLLEVVRPHIEAAIAPADSSRIAGQQGLAFILAQVRADGRPGALKQSFLLANPDFRTRLVEIIARAFVAACLGRSLGRTVAQAYLNEQASAVGGEAVERVAINMQRHLRLAPRTTLESFLQRSVAELEAPLFARAAGD